MYVCITNKWVEVADICINAKIGNQDFLWLEIYLKFLPRLKLQKLTSLITRWANKWVERADIWITAEIGNQDFLRLKISLLTSIIIIEFYRPCSLSLFGLLCSAIVFDHNFVIRYPVVCTIL